MCDMVGKGLGFHRMVYQASCVCLVLARGVESSWESWIVEVLVGRSEVDWARAWMWKD